jgi:NAD(P)-dependent dehydrogenase (short-subunit alcohol dehydrogenase family)
VGDFADRVIVITGAANGIGRACALGFARAGADVVLADRDEAALGEAAGDVERLGRQALAVRCDVTSDSDVDELSARTLERFGRADVLMNNAGISLGGLVEEIPIAEWQRIIDVNVLGVVRGLRAFLPAMIERGDGWIVNTASSIGLFADNALAGPYTFTKAGLIGFSRTLALYLRPKGIGVTALCPRLTDTAFPRNTTVWLRGRSTTTAGAEVRDADTPEQVADLLLAGMREGRFLVAADADAAKRLGRMAADPEGEIERSLAAAASARAGR